MPEFVQATYNENKKTAIFTASDGSILLRKGGSTAWRFFNPGNIQVSSYIKGQPGWIGSGLVHNPKPHNFSIFSSYENGRNANKALLKERYTDSNIYAVMEKFAPGKDGNRPKEYAGRICKETGITKDTLIKEMDDATLEKILDSIEKAEGYIKGKEIVGNTTNITISDGARSIPNHPVKVTLGTKTYEWTTDFFGKLPSIFHTEEGATIEIKSKNSIGKEEVIYKSTMGNKTKNILLKKNYSQYMASTLLDKPNPPRNKNKPKSINYVVRVDDTSLDSIAVRYDVSTSELAKDNGIKESTKIYPGQVLVIYDKRGSIVDQSEQIPWEMKEQTSTVPLIPSIESMGGKTQGSALSTLPHDQKDAPWMETAISEAIKYKGANESVIEKTINYHIEVNEKGPSVMTGTNNAWCASFVNYCLKTKGYAIWLSPTIARHIEKSPNFFKIPKPVWGCIAFITYPHVTFFYGYDSADKNKFIGLGGNQGDTIRFSSFPLSKATFYLPVSYRGKYEVEISKNIDKYNAKELNKLITSGMHAEDNRVR